MLVRENRQGQIYLFQAINELHRTILIKDIAELRAELIAKDCFLDTSIQSALKVASKVRMVMCGALQIIPQLELQKMLLVDVATQGWAVATAKAHLLLEVGEFEEARKLLNFEVPRFKQNAERWANNLLNKERLELNTAYRFTAPVFREHITQERVARIANLPEGDRSAPTFADRNSIYQQVAIAEYLDTFSELSARLETIQYFATLCQIAEVKSSLDLLPSKREGGTWYTLKMSYYRAIAF